MQAHTDAIVFENEVETHFDEIDDLHHDEHHQNDTEEEKSKEHHHHCNVINLSVEFILIDYNFEFIPFFEIIEKINFYETPYNFSFLKGIFQPPKL
ncbi:hypothetical protein [Tenacibaculum crassostreae]|uniref:hypothetical protein n=1 Tax=Tenacibaculum crassostreae TaxID=502683 RepID=UPI0038B602A0